MAQSSGGSLGEVVSSGRGQALTQAICMRVLAKPTVVGGVTPALDHSPPLPDMIKRNRTYLEKGWIKETSVVALLCYARAAEAFCLSDY
jgi:hypothetical protein